MFCYYFYIYFIRRLHQLKREWYHVKAQAVKCVLENVKLPSPSIDGQKYAKKLTKFLLGKTFEAVFKVKFTQNNLFLRYLQLI